MRVRSDYTISGQRLRQFCEALVCQPPAGYACRARPGGSGDDYEFTSYLPLKGVPSATLSLVVRDGFSPSAAVIGIGPSDHNDDALTLAQQNAILTDFAAGTQAFAQSFGLATELTTADRPITHWLSCEAISKAERFSTLANKATGSGHSWDRKRWIDFILRVDRDESAIEPDVLYEYLTTLEWDAPTAAALVREFEFGIAVLQRSRVAS